MTGFWGVIEPFFLREAGFGAEHVRPPSRAPRRNQMRPEDANEDVKYRYILMPMRI